MSGSHRTGRAPPWDEDQWTVIQQPPDRCILVEAGPGTGKTAVACARTDWLIRSADLDPSSILFISFTRAAVLEAQKRVSDRPDGGDPSEVSISTLDSLVGKIRNGFDPDWRITAGSDSYDLNFWWLLDKINTNEDIAEYLMNFDHIIVDEAQDIVGIRASLLIALIERIRTINSGCGVTVFSDRAQAIYGFTVRPGWNQISVSPQDRLTLPERIDQLPGMRFHQLHLRTIHRTKNRNLARIFSETREKVLGPSDDGEEKFSDVMQDLIQSADGTPGSLNAVEIAARKDSAFVLFWKKIAVLTFASDHMGTTPHRIRMGDLPTCIQPWIGACLSESTGPLVTRTAFRDAWTRNVENSPLAVIDLDQAWEILIRLAGNPDRTGIDLTLLRKELGYRPPVDVSFKDLGPGGPLIGTIHAVKGREADHVYLCRNRKLWKKDPDDEDVRLLFVGATRARKSLTIADHFSSRKKSHELHDRVFSNQRTDRPPVQRIQIGIRNDVTFEGAAGKRFYTDPDAVRSSQRSLIELAGGITPASGRLDAARRGYRIMAGSARPRIDKGEEAPPVTWFCNPQLFIDLEEIRSDGGRLQGTLPAAIPDLRIMGVQTLVLPQFNEMENGAMHRPWSRSGIVLAPIVMGFPAFEFSQQGGGPGSQEYGFSL